MTKYILPLAFLLVPFAVLSGGLIHISHHFALIIAGAFLLGAYIKNRWVSAFFFMCGAWQIALCLIVLTNKMHPQMLAGSLYSFMFLLVAGIIYISVYESKLKTETFYNFICVSALLQIVICLTQYFLNFDPHRYLVGLFAQVGASLTESTVTGTLFNPDFVAAYLAISLPFFFRGKLKSFKPQWWWATIPISLILIVSKSSSAAIPAIIGTAFYFGGIKYVALGIIPIAAYILYDRPFEQLNAQLEGGRGAIWMQAWEQIKTQPFVKFLFGNGSMISNRYPLHSEWLTMFQQYGLVGLSLLVGYIATIHRKNRVLFTAFIIAAINMLGNYPLHLAPSAFLILLIVGLIERERI